MMKTMMTAIIMMRMMTMMTRMTTMMTAMIVMTMMTLMSMMTLMMMMTRSNLTRTLSRCTTVDGSAPWCATGPMSWEYCTSSSCPGLEAREEEEVAPHTLNLPGQCCEYRGSRESDLS